MAENLTIEERVTALENAAKYKLRYSGEQIDSFFDTLSARGFEHGRESFTVKKGTSIASQRVTLNIPNATANTRVLATVSYVYSTGQVAAMNVCCFLEYLAGTGYRCYVTNGRYKQSGGAQEGYLPTGTYHVDWLVIGR
mgnify:FL=1